MERFDQSSEDTEPHSPHRSRPALRDDKLGTTIEKSESDRWSPACSFPPALSSASSPSAQLSGVSNQTGTGSSTASNAQQTFDSATETGEHQFPQVERFADSRLAHARDATGWHAASATRTAFATDATKPLSVELRAGGGDGSRRPSLAQSCTKRVQASAAG